MAGVDIDRTCRHPFEKNNSARFIEGDVSRLQPSTIKTLFGKADIKILAGCAPCQPFSTYSLRYEDQDRIRWRLLYEFARLIESLRPDVVAMENVPSIARHRVFSDFVVSLKRSGYRHTWFGVVDCVRYGLPQQRRRMVLMASRLGPIELIDPTHATPITVEDAIGSLPAISAGVTWPADRLHSAATLSALNLQRIRASRPGGSWRDWPKRLIAECHRRETGHSYPSIYGRMDWHAPAPTLTTQFYGFGSGRFGHPEQDRALSLREGAILQGFPRTYSFLPGNEKVYFTKLGTLIGNAVPVVLGRVVGRSIAQHIQ